MLDRRKMSIDSYDKAGVSNSLDDGWKLMIVAGFLAMAGLLFIAPQKAYADGSGNAEVQPDQVCMEEAAGFGLVCTANDVRLAAATDIVINDIDGGCAFPGDTVTFSANFELLLGAQARHDIGIWFAQDGDPNGDGAITGQCTVATPAYAPEPWLDLDGTTDPWPGENKPNPGEIQDSCGDIDNDHNPLFPSITLTVACIDPDNDGKLNLPYCTSWRQSGANELCIGPLDAFPGSPSKCSCDTGFNIGIDVPKAELQVTKTANPSVIDEPGGSVTFTVTVTNTGIDPNNKLTLNSLLDNIYDDITTTGHDGITATTCSVPHTIESDDGSDTYTCEFTADVTGEGGDSETDTVTAAGTDDRGNSIEGSDTATVTINDVLPDITVDKMADPTTVLEPSGAVTFSVLITNNSVSSDPVTIDSLTDDVHGDLNGQGNCSVPLTLAGDGGTYSCSFTADVTGNTGYVETDTVTASGSDDNNNPVSDSDSAVVTVENRPSSIELIKTANPESVEEPGGNVTYTFTVNNLSSVDTVTIRDGLGSVLPMGLGLYDDILGDLNLQGDCRVPQTLYPKDDPLGRGDSYTCTVVARVTGNAFAEITNTAAAEGIDDDNETLRAVDSATVDIDNAPPAASLTKTVTEVLVTYAVEVCNDSDAEVLTLDVLEDNIYGDITHDETDDEPDTNPAIAETTCAVPQTLQPAGETGQCYSCTFDAVTDTSPTTDTVTGTVNDDDGSPPSEPSDSATVTFE